MSNELKQNFMTIDGEIPTSYFLIISLGLTILSYLVYKKKWKIIRSIFLDCFNNNFLLILFYFNFRWT